MIYSKIYGGLGNQMFQYAIGRSIAAKNDVHFKIDIYEMKDYDLRDYSLDKLNITAGIAEDLEINRRWNNRYYNYVCRRLYTLGIKLSNTIFDIENFIFDKSVLSVTEGYLDGYWLSYKYFEGIRDILLQEFTLKNAFNESNLYFLAKIDSCNSVSIHIRRGDYLLSKASADLYDVCGANYYSDAIALMSQRIDKAHYFVFSDDLEFARREINIPNVTFVDANCNENFENDMFLMSKCKHNIIANSTFSWWGAWLNTNENKIVIAPSKWISTLDDSSDLIPEEWIMI